MKETTRLDHELADENKRLRSALEALLAEIEDDPTTTIDTGRVRELLDAGGGGRNEIQPPWEREGYEDKQAWLDDRRETDGDAPV